MSITRRSRYPYALFGLALSFNLAAILPAGLLLQAGGSLTPADLMLFLALGGVLTLPLTRVVLAANVARALLKDAPVLILDEATSSLDLDNEAQIQQAINALWRGRTVIVIAHRLWTIREVDHILVLDGGRIAQQGRHEALLAADGLYRRLWTVQRAAHDWRLTGPDPAAPEFCE